MVDVGGCLKAASYGAGDSYLGELRLCHVEAKRPVLPWLARAFTSMRRGLNRGLGPPQRAVELPLSHLQEETDQLRSRASIEQPKASYVTAVGWMSREIEVANAKMALWPSLKATKATLKFGATRTWWSS